MIDPEIRYARTEDGLSIAYATMGEGQPLLVTAPMGFSHIALELQFAPLRAWYERLAERRMVVRFDWRAQGMSQRNVPAPPDAWGVIDIAAVVEAIGADRIDLIGCGAAGFWGAVFANASPERLRNLVLWGVPADGEVWGAREVEIATSLAGQDYRVFTETVAASILGFEEPATAHAWAQFMRRAMNEDDHHKFFDQPTAPRQGWNLTGEEASAIVNGIAVPTLVLHPSGLRNMPVQNAQELAASIPGARLVICSDDRSGMPIGEQATAAIEMFLDGEARPSRAASKAVASDMAVVLFTDIADSTPLTERMGDAAFRAAARALDEGMRAAMAAAGGTVVEGKVLGDGVMGVFGSASAAIDAALRCVELSAESELRLHVGLHAGDVIREGGNVYGGAVNIASRVCGLSEPGEILVTGTVRELARTSAGVGFEDRGERELKGVGESVRVFAVVPND